MPKINFINAKGEVTTVNAVCGNTLLEIAEDNKINIDGPCGGNLACGRCHVIVEEDWFNKLPKASEREEDLLDGVWGAKPTSRLACQITITDELDGIKILIPSE